ncbi:hypothetical protein [Okeania sp. SIO2C9]|uniref:hypothetical protein n=1 Tax=Okeania sp. SIO2C9 TaxID=2607791 RepID=UPI0025D2BC7D|nr:hypothetical protein [Okeania sp. SIO2C9]
MQYLWLDYRDGHNQNIKITGYPTEKNPDLLNRIIQASSNPNDNLLNLSTTKNAIFLKDKI